MAGRCVLTDVIDDDVLFLLFRYLCDSTILKVCASGAAVCTRLDGFRRYGAKDEEVEEPRTAARQLITQRLAAAIVGNRIADAAAAASVEVDADRLLGVSGYFIVLRMLNSSHHYAKAFRLAFDLVQLPPKINAELLQMPSELLLGRAALFLDEFFYAGIHHLKVQHGKMSGRTCGVANAADAALNTLINDGKLGAILIMACSLAVQQVEGDLDALVNEDRLGGFFDVARRRSAVEFLQGHVAAMDMCTSSESLIFKEACEKLAEAVRELDRTIQGYVEEGYGLSCSFAFSVPPPRSHWWLFLCGPCAAYGVCG